MSSHIRSWSVEDESTRLKKLCKKYVNEQLKINEQSIKLIGEGTYAHVYEFVDENDKSHAIKFCNFGEKAGSFPEYFAQECEISKTLQHKNVVRVFSSYIDDSYMLMDMEMCTTNLKQYLSFDPKAGRKKVIGSREIIVFKEECLRPLIRDVMRGLSYIHRRGVVHRDIKPENILVAYDPKDQSVTAKLGDFGTAKMSENDSFSTTGIGTGYFSAPEVGCGSVSEDSSYSDSYGKRCDLWSIGATIYKLLTGNFVIKEKTTKDGKLPPYITLPEEGLPKDEDELFTAQHRKPEFSDCVRHFVRFLLVRNPKDRYDSEMALKHPFVMPRVNCLQLIHPDTVLGLMGGRPHYVELGDVAFQKAKEKFPDIMNTPDISCDLKWTWEDVGTFFGLKQEEDYFAIAKGGFVYEKKDMVVFPKDEDINVLFAPRNKQIDVADPKVMVKTGTCALTQASELLNDKGECWAVVSFYLKQLHGRWYFCDRIFEEQPSCMVIFKDVFSFKPLVDELSKIQNLISRYNPIFPLIASSNPCRKCELAKVDDALLQQAADFKDSYYSIADDAQTHMDEGESISNEIQSLRVLLKKWQTIENSCLCESLARFNTILDYAREYVDVFVRYKNYIDILKSANGKTFAEVIPELINATLGCPYLQFPNKYSWTLKNPPQGKIFIPDKSDTPVPGPIGPVPGPIGPVPGPITGILPDIRPELERLLFQKTEEYQQLLKEVETLREKQKKLSAVRCDQCTNHYKTITALENLLKQHHIDLDADDSCGIV